MHGGLLGLNFPDLVVTHHRQRHHLHETVRVGSVLTTRSTRMKGTNPMTMTPEQATAFQETFGRLVAGVEQVLLGKTFVVRLGFVALLSEGHLLLEDFPGTGKTSFARAIAQSVAGTRQPHPVHPRPAAR